MKSNKLLVISLFLITLSVIVSSDAFSIISSNTELIFSQNDLTDEDIELINNGTTITHYDPTKVMEGLTLFKNVDDTIYFMDFDGNIVGGRKNAGDPEFVNATTILYTNRATGNTSLWNLVTNETEDFSFPGGHHDIEFNPKTNTFLTVQSVNYGAFPNGTSPYADMPIKYDDLVEYNYTGNETWRWNSSLHILFNETMFLNETARGTVDWTHTNTVFWDIEEDEVYYNPRNLDTFYKIDKTTGDVLWSIGKYGDFTLLNKNGVEVDSLWYHCHAVEKISANHFLLYDNDYYNTSKIDFYNLPLPIPRDGNYTGSTRVIEIEVDETTMIAQEIWSWEYADYFASKWGDADRLPNGNTLACFGDDGFSPARITELTPEGEIAWEVLLNDSNGIALWGVYRAERVLTAPYLEIDQTDFNIMEESVLTIKLSVSDSYRSRMATSGKISVCDSNNNEVGSKTIIFLPYWQLTDIEFTSSDFSNFADIEFGTQTYTIKITNEAGFETSAIITISILEDEASIPGFPGIDIFVIGLISVSLLILKEKKK